MRSPPGQARDPAPSHGVFGDVVDPRLDAALAVDAPYPCSVGTTAIELRPNFRRFGVHKSIRICHIEMLPGPWSISQGRVGCIG